MYNIALLHPHTLVTPLRRNLLERQEKEKLNRETEPECIINRKTIRISVIKIEGVFKSMW